MHVDRAGVVVCQLCAYRRLKGFHPWTKPAPRSDNRRVRGLTQSSCEESRQLRSATVGEKMNCLEFMLQLAVNARRDCK